MTKILHADKPTLIKFGLFFTLLVLAIYIHCFINMLQNTFSMTAAEYANEAAELICK